MTILVASCDKYLDVLTVFSRLFRRHWPDCPFEKVLLTESDRPELGELGFDRIVATGLGKTWSQMMVEGVDAVKTPYLILLMDDYFFSSRIDTAQILSRLDDAVRFDSAILRLLPNPKPPKVFDEKLGLGMYPKDTAYCVATQTGIWAKDFLRDLAVRCGRSAWEFERYGSFMTGGEKRPILCTMEREFPFIDAVHKGYWEPFGVDLCEREGIAIDFGKRGRPPLAVRFKEWMKALVFNANPQLVVKIQNRFNLGAK